MTRLRSYRNVAIQSFIQTISIAPLQSTITQRRSRHNMDTVSEFHAEAPQATASEGLAQGPSWRLERDSNPRPFGRYASNLPMCYHAPRQCEGLHTITLLSKCSISQTKQCVGLCSALIKDAAVNGKKMILQSVLPLIF